MPFPRLDWTPQWFVDETVLKREGNAIQGRKLTYQALELGSNTFPITLMAALGFFTGSYILFASSTVVPMLNDIYWSDGESSSPSIAFNDMTLAGVTIGMLFFGFMADRFGRRHMYKYELFVLIAGTMGLVMSSAGYIPFEATNATSSLAIDYTSYGSMDLSSWLLFWRFVTGIGVGGEYPLSAVIASEYAPTAKRSRILAIVFAMQAFAIATGSVVTLVVIAAVQARHPFDPHDPESLAKAIDQVWRWVVGLGLVPATVTAVLRFTIPESPRYTLDVLHDPVRASEDTEKLRQCCLESNSDAASGLMVRDLEGSASELFAPQCSTVADELSVKRYFMAQGTWRYVVGVASCWFLFDFATYSLSLNETSTLSEFWNGHTNGTSYPAGSRSRTNNYQVLTDNSLHELVIDNLPSIIGSLFLAFFITHLRRKLLFWVMFVIIGGLFVVMGIMLLETVNSPSWGISIGLFAVIKFSEAFSVAPLTFLLPAELFPTKYRCTCYAIAAASGKIGSNLASAFYTNVVYGPTSAGSNGSGGSKGLGYVFIVSAIPMFMAAATARLWIPDVQEPGGENKTLEQLAEPYFASAPINSWSWPRVLERFGWWHTKVKATSYGIEQGEITARIL